MYSNDSSHAILAIGWRSDFFSPEPEQAQSMATATATDAMRPNLVKGVIREDIGCVGGWGYQFLWPKEVTSGVSSSSSSGELP